MLRRDYIQAEIEKLTEILARILGLKKEGKYSLAEDLIIKTIPKEFNVEYAAIKDMSMEAFESFLRTEKFSAPKLTILGQLLFESVYPFEEIPETALILHKVLLNYRLLEEEHHIQSFENLNTRDMINNFLNNRQYE